MKRTFYAVCFAPLLMHSSAQGSDTYQPSRWSFWKLDSLYALVSKIIPQRFLGSASSDSTNVSTPGHEPWLLSDGNVHEWFYRCDRIPLFRELHAQYPIDINNKDSCEVAMKFHCDEIRGKSGIEWSLVSSILTKYKQMCDESALTDPKSWVNQEALPKTFEAKISPRFNPAVLGFKIPEGAIIETFGDQHGAYHSLRAKIKQWQNENKMDENYKLIPRVYIVGVGDYVDRGSTGMETLVTLLILKLQNPHNVILVRGNHENSSLDYNRMYFQRELEYKFPDCIKREKCGTTNVVWLTAESNKNLQKVARVYDTMPVAAVIGYDNKHKTATSYAAFVHACLDVRDNLTPLYVALKTKEVGEFVYKHYDKNSLEYSLNGNAKQILSSDNVLIGSHYYREKCMDHDNVDYENAYIINDDSHTSHRMLGRGGHEYGKPLVDALFKDLEYVETPNIFRRWFLREKPYAAYIHTVLRGHQHTREGFDGYGAAMQELIDRKGCAQAWNQQQSFEESHLVERGSFYTMLAAPGNEYGEALEKCNYPGYTFDTVINLTPSWDNDSVVWRMTKKNITFDRITFGNYGNDRYEL